MECVNNNNTCQQHAPFIKLKSESGSEEIHYSAIYEGLPDSFKLIAEKELNETEENRKLGLQKLREYMHGEDMPVLEDYVLLSLLRSCKYNLKKSKTKLKTFQVKRREIVGNLAEIEWDKIESIIDDFPCGILPYRDRHGRAIVFTRPCGLNMERYEPQDVGVVALAFVLFLLKYPMSTVAGFTYFGECKAPSLYIFCTLLKTVKEMMFNALAFSLRVGRVEILNENYLCRLFKKMMTPLVSKKIMSRVTLHGEGYGNLHEIYDPNLLPEEFGGNTGPLTNAFYRQKLLDFMRELRKETL